MLFSSFPSGPPHNSILLGNSNNMDLSHIPTGKSPRRELQGPRPTPLRVNKDSHKIKKPPLAPQPPAQQPPPRQPVIIYAVSPKIIHTTPADFMNLVQRLTGSSSDMDMDMDMASTNDPFNGNNDGAISPAARFATIEKARSPQGKKQLHQSVDIMGDVEGIAMGQGQGQGLERYGMFQGILSPGPSALSPIPSSFFSPATPDPSLVSFFHDLSPVLHSNRNFMDASFMPSPSNFVSPHTPSIDLFNNFLD